MGGWEILTQNQLNRQAQLNVFELLNKKHMLPVFEGSKKGYRAWKQYFVETVHIQNTPVVIKCAALETCVGPEVKKMFADLGRAALDYLERINRLEEKYGGDDQYLNS